MKIDVLDNEVRVTWLGRTAICTVNEFVEKFKKSDERKRRNLAIMLFDTPTMPIKSVHQVNATKSVSTLDVLEGCAHSVKKFSYNYDVEEEIDNILGPDPYTPLY